MQRFRVEALSIVVAILLFLPSVAAASEPAIGTDGKWRQPRIVLSISASMSSAPNIQGDARESVRNSVALWSNAADIRFEITQTESLSVSPKGLRGDGISLITAAATAENLRLFPRQADSPAAATRIFTDRNGNITEADIVLNPFVEFSTSGAYGTFDLHATITHEIGHLLGLDHSPAWGSVMFDKAAPSLGSTGSGVRRSLPDTDAASLRALYGSSSYERACCAVITGRIAGQPRAAKQRNISVWLEEISTGRLVAATSVTNGNEYELAGLFEGTYRIRVAAEFGRDFAASDDSIVRVEPADLIRKDLRLLPTPTSFSVNLVGTSPQVARLPARMDNDLSRTLFVGGKGLDTGVTRVQIAGTGFSFGYNEFRVSDYGNSVKVISFDLPQLFELPNGIYSLIVEDGNETKRFLIGAFVVNRSEN